MRAADLPGIVQAVRAPLQHFVRESRVRVALLISSSGQVIAQHGFTKSYEIVNVATLAAAVNAAAGSLAQLTGAERWSYLHQAGRNQHLFLAPVRLPASELIMVAIFDGASSLGLTQFFFDRFSEELRQLGVFGRTVPTQNAATFEKDLETAIRIFLSRDESGDD
ncbi:MAG: roadblock/LC7 domain-containing protein [Longimicrobiales bacterium]